MTDGPETLLVGIDGACLPVVEPLVEAGRLPTLGSLFDRGAVGPLESQLPPWTPSAWPSLYTGVNPGKHGVYSFLDYDGYDWDVVDASAVRERSLWELLDAAGRRSVVVNVPVTDPPTSFDGALLSGFVGPDDPGCHPPGLLSEVRDAVGEYRVYSKHEFDDAAPREERIAEYRRLVGMRGRAFRYLVDRFDPDFGFLQFQQTDTVFHDLPGDREAVAAVYEAVDEQLAAVLDACDPATVVVASDHGIGEFESEFRVNEYLRREGYLSAVEDDGSMPSWVPLWRRNLADGGAGSVAGVDVEEASSGDDAGATDDGADRTLPRRVAAASLSACSAVGLTPRRVAAALDRVGLLDPVRRRAPDSVVREAATAERVDFANSVAYMRLPVELGVRINVAGREPDGVVAPAEYESVRAEIIDRLAAAETPAGDPVFSDVLPREEVFHGPHVEDAVDVVTVPRGFEQFPAARLRGDVFGPPGEPWNHKRHGLVSVTGPGIDPGELADAHLLQVAPTVLATLSVPRSDRMDASELPVVDSVGEERYPPKAEPVSAAGDDAVADRLSDLGYL